MRTHIIPLTSVAVAIVLALSSAQAAVITIDHVTVHPGETAIVGVYASSDTGEVISGFNLPFDINNDGFVDVDNDMKGDLPAGFALSDPAISDVIYTNTGFDTPFPQIALAAVDAIPTGTGPNVTLSSVPTLLFNLVINVSGSVPVGTVVPLQIIVPADPLGSLFNVAGPNNPVITLPSVGMPTPGSITVIPEPNSLLAACAGLLMCLPVGARFQRAQQHAGGEG